MAKLLGSIGVVFIAFVCGVLLLPRGNQGAVSLDSTIVDLGVVSDQQPVTHNVVLRNDSAWPVAVTSVETSCACVALDTGGSQLRSQFDVPAGETKRIPLRVSTKSRVGKQRATFVIRTDSSRAPVLAGEVFWSVAPSLAVQPAVILLGEKSPGEIVRTKCQILRPVGGADSGIERFEVSRPMIKVTLADVDAEADAIPGLQPVSSMAVEVTIPPEQDSSGGLIDEQIVIHEKDQAAPPVTVHVVGAIKRDIVFSPDEAVVLVDPSSKSTPFLVRCKVSESLQEADMEVVSVPDGVRVSSLRRVDASNWDMALECVVSTDDAATGFPKGQVITIRFGTTERQYPITLARRRWLSAAP